MICPKCAAAVTVDEAAAGTCPVCGGETRDSKETRNSEEIRNSSVQGAPSSAQNRMLGLFLCGRVLSVFCSPGWR